MTEIIFDLLPGAKLPQYETEGAAAFDLRAYIPSAPRPVCIPPKSRVLFSSGFRVRIPLYYEMQIRPRSGLSIKYGVTILNSPGTIDSDYRGEVGIILYNSGENPFFVQDGDRIAQGVISPLVRFPMCAGEVLNDTDRGESGFGSTGVD